MLQLIIETECLSLNFVFPRNHWMVRIKNVGWALDIVLYCAEQPEGTVWPWPFCTAQLTLRWVYLSAWLYVVNKAISYKFVTSAVYTECKTDSIGQQHIFQDSDNKNSMRNWVNNNNNNNNNNNTSRFNPLNRKRRPLYLKTQFVPRSKHFSTRL